MGRLFVCVLVSLPPFSLTFITVEFHWNNYRKHQMRAVRIFRPCAALAAFRFQSTWVNPLPKQRQIRGRLEYNWEQEAAKIGSFANDISPPLQDTDRTEASRQKVAGWKPVVNVVGDRRLRVALIGKMNSGKSSLYNLLCQDSFNPSKHNIVKDFNGITRDSVEGHAELNDMHLTIIDTPGMVGGRVIEESFRTIETADVAVIVASSDEPISPEEKELAMYLSMKNLPCFLVINKMDLVPLDDREKVIDSISADLANLGAAIPISVRRKDGLEALQAAIEPLYHIHTMKAIENDWDMEDAALRGDESAMEEIRTRNSSDPVIRVAIVGRTNCGKSSLLNRLVGFERSVSSDESNTTRDPVEVSCTYRGKKMKIIDTAGLSRQRYRTDKEFISKLHELSMSEIRFAHVVIVVFDATEGHPNKYDMSVLHKVASEGRPFVLCANKWDAVLDQAATAEAIDFKIKRQVREVKYSNAVVVSAHTGMNLTLLLDQVLELYERWNKRVRMSDLVKFWRKLEKSVIIPYHVARVGRIIQVNTRPPTFLLQLQTKNDENVLPRALQEMMKNAITEEFGFEGVPIRLIQEVKDSNPDYV
ncbi:GTP-binding protein [Angomonas deanei]|uniref:GTPase Der n=1 Tax=Angomonas deanei TaxID=59799 RepID=A0A7G2CAI1_9TRYP|nr:GTP-binding protein [Angomonas deanei]CAD2215897.1 Elongation factor Tu GTP binding domain/Signal recognition particle receptor beta subunit/50S ribosome-binding GTPase/Ras of Complex, Roc, domain of DAPkinase/Ferrous iron transport protein B/AIG1 family/Ras family/KH-domain-like of EngA bacterial GTPase enzymes, C-terminal, putative [Angomonas deanei]|eukprot:EPY35855.1 GTP-binding protein [Angomonas deanei]